MKQTLIAVLGAIVGGALGYFTVPVFIRFGLYPAVLPGGLLGIGAGLGRTRTIALPIAFGLAALGLGLFTEWRHFPFVADASLAFFARHVLEVNPMSLVLIALGGALGFWIPFRRLERSPAKAA